MSRDRHRPSPRRNPCSPLGAVVLGVVVTACGATGPAARGPEATPAAPVEEAPSSGTIVVLVDTSAPRARDLEREVALVRELAAAADPSKHLTVAAYDEDVAVVFDGPVRELDPDLGNRVAARGALGASNATRAVGWALDPARARVERVIVMTDGVDDGRAVDSASLGPIREGVRLELVSVADHVGPASAAAPPPTIEGLVARARPLPADTSNGMSLDPLADALPARAIPAPAVTVEVATDSIAPASAGPTSPSSVATIAHRIPPETIQAIVRRNFGRFRGCYREALHRDPRVQGKLVVRFEIGEQGVVRSARAIESDVKSPDLTACVVRGFEAIEFPAPPPDSGPVAVSYPIVFSKGDAAAEPAGSFRPLSTTPQAPKQRELKEPRHGVARDVYDAIARGDAPRAVALARAEAAAAPSLQSFLLLGDAARANGDPALATRAYASLLDGSTPTASTLGLVGARLLTLGTERRARAEACLLSALAARPGDASALELLASSRAEAGDLWAALQLLDVGLGADFLRGLEGAKVDVVRETFRRQMALYAAAFAQQRPNDRSLLVRWLADVGAEVAAGPGLTVSAAFDGGGADVDLVVRDASLSAATKATPSLAAGGALAGDAPSAPGVELFSVDGGAERRAYPFEISVELVKGGAPFAAGIITTATYEGAGRVVLSRAPFYLDVPDGGGVVATLLRP